MENTEAVQPTEEGGLLDSVTTEDSHAGWMKFKTEHGWAYGEVEDAEKKTHPCLVPYAELPAEQRVKDALFFAIVTSLRDGVIA